MAEGILKFNLPEEQSDFKLAVKAKDILIALNAFDNSLRTYCKHGHKFKDADDAVESIRRELHDDLASYHINLDELE